MASKVLVLSLACLVAIQAVDSTPGACSGDDDDDAAGACAVSSGGGSDAILLQRAWKQTIATGPLGTLGRSIGPVGPPLGKEEYDCNGDGVPDCGRWDYQMSMCSNRAYCGHRYKVGDWTLDQSCRCRRCHHDALRSTAFGDAQLQRPALSVFNAMSWGTFRVWADHLDTCSPWIMPKSEGDLRKALAYAKEQGYKVRISGAGHSAGGLVTDGRDPSVFVVSLAEYAAAGEWEFGLRSMPDGSQRATVNAGWTQAHLFEKIRPLGLFVPAQTAGYFFALGGLVANSVHGGAYNAGFIHSYATRMRVMSHDGSVRIIDDEDELRYWRCSFGLLGVILGIEFQLEQRSHLQMYTVTRKMDAWNAEEFWRFIKQDAEANVPEGVVAEGGAGSRASWNGEFFVDWMTDGDQPTAAVYAQKANSSVDPTFRGQLGIPRFVKAKYRRLLNKRVVDDWHGRMSWGEAARRDGAPPIAVAGVDVNDALRGLRALPLAKTMSMAAITNLPRLVRTQRERVNDGFFLTLSPAALAAAYFVPPSKAFAAMDKLRQVQRASVGSTDFVWNLPGEFRFVRVQDSAVLQPVEAGLWFNAQMISFADLAKNDQAWKRDFKVVEDHWVKELGARPHMGKLWGFSTQGDGTVEPFSDEFACSIYSEATKAIFSTYRLQEDPNDLFFSGLGANLLGPCH